MNDLPEGTIGIEIRGIYDGVCAYRLPDGTYRNRFDRDIDPRRWRAVEDWIAAETKQERSDA